MFYPTANFHIVFLGSVVSLLSLQLLACTDEEGEQNTGTQNNKVDTSGKQDPDSEDEKAGEDGENQEETFCTDGTCHPVNINSLQPLPDSPVLNIDAELTCRVSSPIWDECSWTARLQAVLKKKEEHLSGSICLVSGLVAGIGQSLYPREEAYCTSVKGSVSGDTIAFEPFSLPSNLSIGKYGQIQSADFDALELRQKQGGIWQGRWSAHFTQTFQDLWDEHPMAGPAEAVLDVEPPRAALRADHVLALDPMILDFSEPVAAKNLQVDILHGLEPFPIKIVPHRTVLLKGLVSSIEMVPERLWGEGGYRVEVSGAKDAGDNSAKKIVATFTVEPVPDSAKNLGLEDTENPFGFILDGCEPAKEYPYDMGGGTVDRNYKNPVMPSQGNSMIVCEQHYSSLRGFFQPLSEMRKILFDLGIGHRYGLKVYMVAAELVSSQGRTAIINSDDIVVQANFVNEHWSGFQTIEADLPTDAAEGVWLEFHFRSAWVEPETPEWYALDNIRFEP